MERDHELTRVEFEDSINDLCQANLELVKQALAAARLSPCQVDGVIFVGGGSRIPALCRRVEALFGQREAIQDVDKDKAVVMGAARGIGEKITERILAGD